MINVIKNLQFAIWIIQLFSDRGLDPFAFYNFNWWVLESQRPQLSNQGGNLHAKQTIGKSILSVQLLHTFQHIVILIQILQQPPLTTYSQCYQRTSNFWVFDVPDTQDIGHSRHSNETLNNKIRQYHNVFAIIKLLHARHQYQMVPSKCLDLFV